MSVPLLILCYHRVVGSAADAWPYLERGTAVQVAVFERQLAELRDRFDILDHPDAVAVLTGNLRLRRPAVWLTFDDGYVETLTTVAPRLAAAEATGTAFITTATLEQDAWLPADRWYHLLLRAGRPRGTVDLGLGPIAFDLTNSAGRARLVHGPERARYLRRGASEQARLLVALAGALDAPLEFVGAPYLTPHDLRRLLASGWHVGSHGASHTPMDAMDDVAVGREAAVARGALVAAVGHPVDAFALPDGSAPADVDAIHRVGYRCVLGLGDRPALAGAAVAPRFIVGNDPDWVRRTLPRPTEAA